MQLSDSMLGRRAVFGRPAFQNVGDIDLVASQAHSLGDHVGQELAGPADERLALTIFVGARGLADEHQPRLGGPGAEDGLGPCLGQVGTLAAVLPPRSASRLEQRRPLASRNAAACRTPTP